MEFGVRLKVNFSSKFFGCLLLLGALSPVYSADGSGQFLVRGIGAQSCGVLIESLEGEQREENILRFSDWVSGWISHANRATNDVYDVHPIYETIAIVEIARRICAANTGALVEDVLHSSVSSVVKWAASTRSEFIEVDNQGKSVNIRGEILLNLQRKLSDLGFMDAAKADGLFGPATISALEKFQKSSGLIVSGLPDPLTVYLVFLD